MSGNLISFITQTLQTVPGLAIFLALTLGYAIGQIRLGPIQLGGVCGTLIAALVIGQLNIPVDTDIKNVFFMLFIFALGYSGGPQFFANLNAKNIQLGLFCLIEVVVVLGLVLTATVVMHLDPGTAAGMMAGAATESAVVGTATDAISRLDLPASEIIRLQGNVVTAYSITYICGLITIVIVTSQIFPLLLRTNLRVDAEKLWVEMGGQVDTEGISAVPTVVGRVYRLDAGAGHTVAELQQRLGQESSIVRVQRHGRTLTLSPSLRLRRGDQVLLVGYRGTVIEMAAILGTEVADTNIAAALDTYHVIVLEPAMSNRELRELELPTGVHVAAVLRGDAMLPALPATRLQVHDVLQIYDANPGRAPIAAPALSKIGKMMPDKLASNLAIVGLVIALGTWLGSFKLNIGGIDFSAGTGGGVLIVGLVMGWYHARRADLHSVNADALTLLKDLGLAGFIAGVGLSSGPQALSLIMQYGITLPLLGVAIAIIPASVSLVVGHFWLKLRAPVLLGAIAGQQCSTPALSAIQNACGNSTPLLGYTITYAISNVVLPLMGPLIVGLASSLQPL
ncbi:MULTISPECIES: aspartate-alanine antiporter [Rahnella]|jgi:aspartate-alanine antiporter|uniref:aspartate-alanine antiporter n=1 Tax=Rahnella TaxID=34037 RepID=UPI000BB1B1A5|nr:MULTISPECIES: aspartate-alanine antiporter [Rahnella]PBI77662.1 aspartate-alanine antiporter [Rahnella victoriana]TBX32900.1 aspartate-alanine antiporter [Rahnella victoriana]TDS97963.1 aspartate-alanine antiporter [Rahnella sp. BIGb0236]